MRHLIIYLMLFFVLDMSAQTPEVETDTVEKEFFVILGDTVVRNKIDLDEVVIMNKLNFKSDLERRKYLILRRKTRKVYPYAKLASERLVTLNMRLQDIKSKRASKKVYQDHSRLYREAICRRS